MKKKLPLLIFVFLYDFFFAQIGINSTTPKATLDIVGKSGNSDIDGVIAPRLTRAQLTAKGNSLYGANQNGTIIYITDVSSGDSLSQRVNITSSGYYYFDALTNVWKKFTNGNEVPIEPWNIINSTTSASANNQNIYQNARVGVGNFSASGITSSLEILGGGTSQLGLSESITGTKWDISSESGAITFTQRRPSNERDFIFYNNGSVAFGSAMINANYPNTANATGFYFDYPNKRLKLGTASNLATEMLDIDGNARIRSMVDGSDKITFTKSVVCKPDGTLGFTDRGYVNKTTLVNDATPFASLNTIGTGSAIVNSGNFTSNKGGTLFFTGSAQLSVNNGSVVVGFELYIDGVKVEETKLFFETASKNTFNLNWIIPNISMGNHLWQLKINGNGASSNNSFVDSNHRHSLKLTEILTI